MALALVFVLALGGSYAVYAWQHDKIETLNKTAANNSQQVASLQKQLSDHTAAQAAAEKKVTDTAASVPAPETDQAHVQRVATAYRHTSKKAEQTDKPSFTATEKTVINGNFAIQYYYGPGECSQIWLKKVGNTWTVLGVGLSLAGSDLQKYINDYGWPAGFTQ